MLKEVHSEDAGRQPHHMAALKDLVAVQTLLQSSILLLERYVRAVRGLGVTLPVCFDGVISPWPSAVSGATAWIRGLDWLKLLPEVNGFSPVDPARGASLALPHATKCRAQPLAVPRSKGLSGVST